MRIRPGRADERERLETLRRRAAQHSGTYREAIEAAPAAARIGDGALEDGRVWVICVDGEPAGFSEWRPAAERVWELEGLFVEPEAMGRGLGGGLLADLLARAREAGIARVEVSANPDAVGFYERAGFWREEAVSTPFGPAQRMAVETFARNQGGSVGPERLALAGLALAMALAAATILYLGRDFSFWSDELTWLLFGSGFDPETLLTPHNGHLIAIPRLVYELFPRLFDDSYLPFRLLALATFLCCVGLFFALARRRVGGPVALGPSVVLLFFGSATVIVLSPLALPFTLSIAFGLGALLAVEAGGRRDVAAVALLVLSLLSHSFGGLIAVGVVVYLLRRSGGRARLWVPLVPIGLYAVWWLWALRFDQGIASLSNLGDVPAFVAESAVATLAALSGFAGPTLPGPLSGAAEVVEVLVVAALALALALLAFRLRDREPGAWLWAYLAILLAFWVGLGLSEGPGREPTTPRYLFFGSVMLLLVVAERIRGIRLGRLPLLALLAGCAVSLALNASRLERAADGITEQVREAEALREALEREAR